MNHLSPVIAQALAPFIQPMSEPAKYINPPPRRDQIVYEWEALKEPIACRLECEPAERGARERGTCLQLEPDYPESVQLVAAYLRGIDILPILCEDQIEQIEALALQSME